MADKLLILVAAQHVSVAQWRGRNFTACEKFTNDESGLAAFRAYLGTLRKVPVHVMVDAVEEDYRFDTLPHSFGGERREMVARKLKQHFRNTPYCGAQLIGRDSGKRRDDRYMFAALTNPDLIGGWLQAIAARAFPLAGVYLLPTVSRSLLHRLQLKSPNLLVVSVHSSGLRLTYFRDQKLRVSRLARTDDSGATSHKAYSEEISNTRLYLHALRVMSLDEQLTVLVVDHGDVLANLAQTIARDNPNVDCQRLSRKDIVARIGVTAAMLEASADALYLHLLGLHAPSMNLAAADLTAGFRQHRWRKGVYAGTGAVVVAALVWCAVNLYQDFEVRTQTEDAARAAARLQAEYDAITRQFPAAPTSAENLRRAVEISRKIGTTLRSPEPMFVAIGAALEAHPAIALHKLGWKYGLSEIDADASTAAPAQAAAKPPPTPLPNAPVTSARRQTGLIEGEVRPFRGDYRAAIEAINAFAVTLGKQPGVADVRVIKLPLSIGPALALSGNTTENRGQGSKAEFKLVVYMSTQS